MSCCGEGKRCEKKKDFLLWGAGGIVFIAYLGHFFFFSDLERIPYFSVFAHSIFSLMNQMWWGLLLGILFVSLLSIVPKEFVVSALGKRGKVSGILRATFAGLLLDLCNHGILLVGMQLYRRGASLGQTMAFLIASPWNSLSLTFILIALIGFSWTLIFVLLSGVIAVLSGVLFEKLVQWRILPENENHQELPDDFHFWPEARKRFSKVKWTPKFIGEMIKNGILESQMIVKWIFVGAILVGILQTFVSDLILEKYFGPSFIGLFLTLGAATVIEVCSEGSAPIASELMNRASAPGNSFTFLMAGASTDYTEIMALKETTGFWKTALFLPLITVPQIVVAGFILNCLSWP